MEFSATPFPMSRRGVMDMGKLFGTPTYRWVDGLGTITVRFVVYVGRTSESGLFDQAVRQLRM